MKVQFRCTSVIVCRVIFVILFAAFQSFSLETTPVSPVVPTVCSLQKAESGCPVGTSCVPVSMEGGGGDDEASDGICVPEATSASNASSTTAAPTAPTSVRELVVKVVNQTLTLPTDHTVLSAYTISPPDDNVTFEYKWTLLTHPEEDTIGQESQDGAELRLTKLKIGNYTYRVDVRTPDDKARGVTWARVTVLPASRRNEAPHARIDPPFQKVMVPVGSPSSGTDGASAVFDGSGSSDDTKITAYQWAITACPINFALSDKTKRTMDTSTIQIDQLIPGNYSVELTVTDEDGEANSTTAQLVAEKQPDYPPNPDAGEDKILILPQDSVVLNGNQSKDVQGIKLYEWKMVSGSKSPDLEGTDTPYLKVSKLSAGTYTFELRVTDTAGQSETDSVNVVVKEPSFEGPRVDAGPGGAITLPQSTYQLDGSNTRSEGEVKRWRWRVITQPTDQATGEPVSEPTILNPHHAKTNVTGLTKGAYVFELSVTDAQGLTNSANVTVKVLQATNFPPKADAGGDLVVVLPQSQVILDGSRSSDDVRITRWEWSRCPDSCAAGEMVKASLNTSRLIVTGLEEGDYRFRLTVFDESGASDSAEVSLKVKPNPYFQDELELRLMVPVRSLKQSDLDRVLQGLGEVVRQRRLTPENQSVVDVLFLGVRPSRGHEHTVIRFLVQEKTQANQPVKVLPGFLLSRDLRRVLLSPTEAQTTSNGSSYVLGWPVADVDTVTCQNPCSSHGSCDPILRSCICNKAWMENPLRRRFGDGEPNCDWNILYVILAWIATLAVVFCLIWSGLYLVTRFGWSGVGAVDRKKSLTGARYYPVADTDGTEEAGDDDGYPMAFNPGSLSLHNLGASDSDESESDVLFQSRPRIRGLRCPQSDLGPSLMEPA